MNVITILLQTQGAAAQGQQGSSLSFWVMILLIFVIMWLFMFRPQRKQQKELEKFRNELKKGDKVVTAGGIYGTVAEIQENSILLKVDGDVKIRVAKASIQRDYSEAQAAGQSADQKQ